jgi:hypothetical protein
MKKQTNIISAILILIAYKIAYCDLIMPLAWYYALSEIEFWPLTIAALGLEIIIFIKINKTKVIRSILAVLFANIASAILGLFAVIILPSGNNLEETSWKSKIIIITAFLVAFLVSILIEWLIYKIRFIKCPKPFKSSLFCNIASYALLGIGLLFFAILK